MESLSESKGIFRTRFFVRQKSNTQNTIYYIYLFTFYPMKKNIIIATLAFGLVFLLASCSTTSNHTMEDSTTMSGTTHEESSSHEEGDSHAMDDGTTMDGATHQESTSEDSHSMDDGEKMEGKTHEDTPIKKAETTKTQTS